MPVRFCVLRVRVEEPLELRHLRYFVAVAETRHFGKAAEHLHIAQPSLSQAIRQLESELGADLFARTTRQVDLTPAGAVFHDDACRILSSVQDTSHRVRRVADGRHGVLRVGLTGLASYRYLPEIARIVKQDMPGVALDLQTEMLTPTQERALIESRIDVGLLRPPTREDGIVHRSIAREPLVLVVPEHHRLAGDEAVGMADLRSEEFVLYSAASRSVVNDAVVRSCTAAGFYPHREHEVSETSVLLALVAAGLGVALVPDSVRCLSLRGVVFVPVLDAESVELALAWRAEDSSPLLRNLLTTLDERDVFALPDEREEIR